MTDEGDQYRQIFIQSANKRRKTCLFCFSRLVPMYKTNKVSTSKYNILTFLPLNLFLQFSKMVNFYFLVLTLMELVPAISDSGGQPVLAVPLSFVVSISMIKDIYEDVMRHR